MRWIAALGAIAAKLGHEVQLMSGRMVKPFVVGDKNDAADANAF
jgi:hypothetical protein